MIIYTTYIHRIIKDAKRSSFRVFCEFSLQSLWKLLSLTWPWVWGPHMKGLSNSARPSPWCNVVVPLFLEVKYLWDTNHFSTACCIERNEKNEMKCKSRKKIGSSKIFKMTEFRPPDVRPLFACQVRRSSTRLSKFPHLWTSKNLMRGI